jgi:hypothetical protein
MPIKLTCSCGQTLNVPENLAGKTGKCPKCQKPIQIPNPAASKTAAPAAAKPVAGTPAQTKPAAGKPAAGKPAAGKPAAGKPAAGKPAAGPVSARGTAPVAVAPQPHKMESLFEEAGLKRKTGPVCPKCGADIRPGTVMCVGCGLNFETGEQAAGFNFVAQGPEFRNEVLQEAASNMTRDVLMDQRRDKSGIPWWMIMSYLIGAITLCAAGVVIVDGQFSEPSPAGTPLGELQRVPVFVVLGMTLVITGQCIHAFAHLSIVVFGFMKSWGAGLGCLFVPFFSYVYGIMNWADNKSAVMAVVTSMITVGIGIGLVVAGGGFGTLQAFMRSLGIS